MIDVKHNFVKTDTNKYVEILPLYLICLQPTYLWNLLAVNHSYASPACCYYSPSNKINSFFTGLNYCNSIKEKTPAKRKKAAHRARHSLFYILQVLLLHSLIMYRKSVHVYMWECVLAWVIYHRLGVINMTCLYYSGLCAIEGWRLCFVTEDWGRRTGLVNDFNPGRELGYH